MTRPRPAFALLCGLAILAQITNETPADDKARPAEAKKGDLSKLPNDDVLKQAAAIHAKGSGDYRAAARALAGAEALLDDATKQLAALAALAAPKPEPKKPGATAEEVAKAAVDAAKAKAEFAKAVLKVTQTRKALQEKVVAGVEGVQSAAAAFQTALDDLKPYAVELALRRKDGTLSDEPPAELTPDALARTAKDLAADLDTFKGKLADARKAVEIGAKALEEAGKGVVTAEAEVTEASKVYGREQQRMELEKKYTGKTPDEMVAELTQLVQDGVGLKGTYELAYRQFAARAADADALRKELAALKQPEVKIAQLTRAEDVQAAAKAVEGLIGYYTARGEKIAALRAHLANLAKFGTEFEGDAAVSDDHLFQMQVLANLLDKAGAADKIPGQAGLKRLETAADRAKKLAAEVRAATEKAKAELPGLDKDATEAKAAGAAAAQQLASLKQSQEATLAAFRFEEQLGKMPTAEVLAQFQTLRKTVGASGGALKELEDAYRKAAATAAEVRAKLDALKDPLLRAAEEAGQAEKARIVAELRKEAGLDRGTKEPVPGTTPPPAGTTKPDDANKPSEEKKPEPPPPPPLERVTARLSGFQQQLAARVRVLDERAEKATSLVAALEDLEKKTDAYSRALTDARQAVLQLNAAAVDIKKRVGRGDLEATQIPEGVTEALAVEARKKLDADAAAPLNALTQTRRELDALRKPDPQADALKTLAKELLALAGKRIDRLDDLKKLAADYRVAKKDRPASEQKRLDQTAAERMARDAGKWEWLLSADSSKSATSLGELMETYYREVAEIEDREANLLKQKKAVEELVALAGEERTAVQKGLPLLEKELARLESAREEDIVLTRARLKPDAAEELLKAFQAKTGRVLPKPLPLADQDKSAKVDELGAALFERYVEVEAARKWEEVLAARLATAGLTAEGGVYQDELAQLNATSGANARRVEVLTGNPPPEPGKFGTGEQTKAAAVGGEIGKTRAEFDGVRTRGVQSLGIKIGIILLIAFLLPRVVMFVLPRALGGKTDPGGSMALTAIGAFLKVVVWVGAVAAVLRVLGFDVTAIIAGLGIGGLAIGFAAQPMIADVIGAVIIFAERRFKIGDVIRVGPDEPARVVGLTWRSTALKNPDGLIVSIPNRKMTEATVQNLTKSGQTYDSLAVTVNTDKDVARLVEVIGKAMDGCANLTPDHGVSVRKFTQKGNTKVVEYRFWWFLRDYESRNKTRDEVIARIGEELAHENMAGTEVTMA